MCYKFDWKQTESVSTRAVLTRTTQLINITAIAVVFLIPDWRTHKMGITFWPKAKMQNAIWYKCILQFESNIFGNLRQKKFSNVSHFFVI